MTGTFPAEFVILTKFNGFIRRVNTVIPSITSPAIQNASAICTLIMIVTAMAILFV